jgi:hypothetical protein
VNVSDHAQLEIARTDPTHGAKVMHAANRTPASGVGVAPSGQARDAQTSPAASHTGRAQKPTDVPRVMLTICEAASSLGVSSDTFRRFVLPELRVVRASPRLTLVRVAELERWAARREAVSELG